MNLATEHKIWTEAELMSLPDVGGKYELVEGELVVVAAGLEHEDLVADLTSALRRFARKHGLGRAWASNLGYWMKNGNLRCPDVSFVAKDRLKSMTRDPKGFLYGAPDLAVEILSPSNTVNAMKKKALEYFENGSRLVWIVDPEDRTITVLRPNGTETTKTDTLTGEDVIPGLSLTLSELFEDLE
jgi:Uma2 family endonuclease